MGYDISILYNKIYYKKTTCECGDDEDCDGDCGNPTPRRDNFMEIGFNFSYNHCENLKAVGFYPRDFNGKTMREVLLALNTAITKMLTDGVSPLEMIRDMESFQKHPELYPPKKIDDRFHEAKMENLLAILMRTRETIERKFAKELDVLYWHSD
jgi:hypothetical protein